MTGDIVAFIKARLDEDERIANAAADAFLYGDRIGLEYDKLHPSICMHVYSWTTARVLREVEAKRRMLALHPHQRFVEPLYAESKFEEDHRPAFDEAPRYVGCERCNVDRLEEVYPTWWCEHVRLLALPYADHPDYREEWRR